MDLKKLRNALITGGCIGLAGVLITRKGEGLLEITSNLFFFAGISLFVAALFAFTMHLGFFDNIIYSFKRTEEVLSKKTFRREDSELGDRYQYSQAHHRGGVRRELFVSSVIMLAISLVLALVGAK